MIEITWPSIFTFGGIASAIVFFWQIRSFKTEYTEEIKKNVLERETHLNRTTMLENQVVDLKAAISKHVTTSDLDGVFKDMNRLERSQDELRKELNEKLDFLIKLVVEQQVKK